MGVRLKERSDGIGRCDPTASKDQMTDVRRIEELDKEKKRIKDRNKEVKEKKKQDCSRYKCSKTKIFEDLSRNGTQIDLSHQVSSTPDTGVDIIAYGDVAGLKGYPKCKKNPSEENCPKVGANQRRFQCKTTLDG